MTFGERLRAARKQKKLTQKELAKLINAAHNSISNWENDQNKPDPDTIQNLCWALDVQPNYFFGEAQAKDVLPPPHIAEDVPNNVTPITTDRIPLVGRIACGEPILAEEHIEDHVDLPRHIKADFALECSGDSMIGAGIRDGDIVYIRKQPTVENGEIAAVVIDGEEATLKRFYRSGNKVTLSAENPAYDPFVYVGEEINTIRIVGRAVGFTHKL